ncbi:MAG TPA: quinone oxidoreductase [Thermoanaerobaculia bacterium]|jgi:NADPH2:quinone reductase|nr:quinone oxidoreductase [Thermoanaerobaculia bacterium]
MKAIRVSRNGGPEVLEYAEVEKPAPKGGEALVKLEAIGVNFIDVYHRTGLYPMPLPFTPGSEGAGVVEAVGGGATEVQPGDRVAWAGVRGAYAEYAIVAADKLVPLPDSIDARAAAAAMLQGMTAHYLINSTFVLREGHTALVHAAAGGVGGILVQMAKARGARVFGTASTTKLDIVHGDGADAVIDYTTQDFQAEVMRLTDGRGVDVVYDSVGRTTFDKSLESLATRGMLALFGQSSGTVPALEPSRLAKKAAFLTRPSLGHYTEKREELLWRARDLFADLESGKVRLRIDRELPLREAGEAHRLLEGRKTAGKALLIP